MRDVGCRLQTFASRAARLHDSSDCEGPWIKLAGVMRSLAVAYGARPGLLPHLPLSLALSWRWRTLVGAGVLGGGTLRR
jgi:hypothetical protein